MSSLGHLSSHNQLHQNHQDLRAQLEEFGIDTYIVGQKVEGGAYNFRVLEVDYTSTSSSATLRERRKQSFPNWMTMHDGARYLIVRYFEDPTPDIRQTVNEVTVFGETSPETDELHAAYVPLQVPLEWLKVELFQPASEIVA